MNRSLSAELAPSFMGCFSVLILDNEVTVENFVATPPLPWGRLVENQGSYTMAEGYPCELSLEQAERGKAVLGSGFHSRNRQRAGSIGGGAGLRGLREQRGAGPALGAGAARGMAGGEVGRSLWKQPA